MNFVWDSSGAISTAYFGERKETWAKNCEDAPGDGVEFPGDQHRKPEKCGR